MSRNESMVSSKWNIRFVILFSFIQGSVGLWYSWYRYHNVVNQVDTQWYQWTHLILIGLGGGLCLLATVLFLFQKSLAWSVFVAGIVMIPLVSFIIMVVSRGYGYVQDMVQNNVASYWTLLSPWAIAVQSFSIVAVLISYAWSYVEERKKKKSDGENKERKDSNE